MNFSQRFGQPQGYASPFYQQQPHRSPSSPLPHTKSHRSLSSSGTGDAKSNSKKVITVQWDARPPTPSSQRKRNQEVPIPPKPITHLLKKEACAVNGWQAFCSLIPYGATNSQQLLYPEPAPSSSSSDGDSFATGGSPRKTRTRRQRRYEYAVSSVDGTPFRLLLNVNDQSTLAALRHAQKRGKRIIFPELEHHNAKGQLVPDSGRKGFSVSPRRRAPEASAPSGPPTAGKSLAGRTLSSNVILHRSNTDTVVPEVKRILESSGSVDGGPSALARVDEEEHEDAVSAGAVSPVVVSAAALDAKPKIMLNNLLVPALAIGGVGADAGSAGGSSIGTNSTGRARGTTASSFDDPSLISELLLGPGGVQGSLSARSRAGGGSGGMSGRGARSTSGGSANSLGINSNNGVAGTGASSSSRTPGKTADPTTASSALTASFANKPSGGGGGGGVLSPLSGWPGSLPGAQNPAHGSFAFVAAAGARGVVGASQHSRSATTTGPVRSRAPSNLAATSSNIAASNAALELALQQASTTTATSSSPHHHHSVSLNDAAIAGLSPNRRRASPVPILNAGAAAPVPASATTMAGGATSSSSGGGGSNKFTGALKGLGTGIVNTLASSTSSGALHHPTAAMPGKAMATAGTTTRTTTAASAPLSPSHSQPQAPPQLASTGGGAPFPSASRPFYERFLPSNLLNTAPIRSLKAALGSSSSGATTSAAAPQPTAGQGQGQGQGTSSSKK
jgi:hypothetical protein